MTAYPSDLTDREWEIISEMIPQAKKGGRPRSVNIRSIVNAIFYVLENGIKWRSLPHDYPAWETVYWYFKVWAEDGTIVRIHKKLRQITRVTAGKKPEETVAIIDSQSTRTTEEASIKGFDAGKKTKGRKRHIAVDTMGLLVEVLIHSAGIQDRDGGRFLFSKAKTNGATFTKSYADGGYAGKLIDWAKLTWDIDLEIVKRSDQKKFVVLPKRWIVERTLSWLNR